MTPYDEDGAPYVGGSDTSEAAAASMAPHTARLRSLVTQAFLRRGPRGFTNDEVEQELDLIHQCCSARVRELVIAKVLVETEERRLTRSGRKAVVKIHAIYAHPREDD